MNTNSSRTESEGAMGAGKVGERKREGGREKEIERVRGKRGRRREGMTRKEKERSRRERWRGKKTEERQKDTHTDRRADRQRQGEKRRIVVAGALEGERGRLID